MKEGDVGRGVSKLAATILGQMSNDEVGVLLKNDPLILQVLEFQLHGRGQGPRPNWDKNLAYKLRLLGRFLLEARNILPQCTTLRDVLQPYHFKEMVEAAKRVGLKKKPEEWEGDDNAGEDNMADSVPTKVGFILKHAAKQIASDLMMAKNADSSKIETANRLVELFKNRWSTMVDSCLLLAAKDKKIAKAEEVPSAEVFSKWLYWGL
jgi:hypothetical protein